MRISHSFDYPVPVTSYKAESPIIETKNARLIYSSILDVQMKTHDLVLVYDKDQYPHLFHILKKNQVQEQSRDPILGTKRNSSSERRYIHFFRGNISSSHSNDVLVDGHLVPSSGAVGFSLDLFYGEISGYFFYCVVCQPGCLVFLEMLHAIQYSLTFSVIEVCMYIYYIYHISNNILQTKFSCTKHMFITSAQIKK